MSGGRFAPSVDQLKALQSRIYRAYQEGVGFVLAGDDIAVASFALGVFTGTQLPGYPQPLTEAERKALNALHRWLHSPGGDGMLTEEAADFHEQLEAECASECDRLEEEERLAHARPWIAPEGGTDV